MTQAYYTTLMGAEVKSWYKKLSIPYFLLGTECGGMVKAEGIPQNCPPSGIVIGQFCKSHPFLKA